MFSLCCQFTHVPLLFYASVPMGMARTQTSPKEQAIAKVARRLRESERDEVNGSFLKEEGSIGNEDSCDTACGNGYPGWPGTSVFRMLIPPQKVGAIIGPKGERVRRLCEETKACVRIIGGHLCATEHAVSYLGLIKDVLYFLLKIMLFCIHLLQLILLSRLCLSFHSCHSYFEECWNLFCRLFIAVILGFKLIRTSRVS